MVARSPKRSTDVTEVVTDVTEEVTEVAVTDVTVVTVVAVVGTVAVMEVPVNVVLVYVVVTVVDCLGGRRLSHTLCTHAIAAAAATTASVLQLASLIASQIPWVEVSYLFVVLHIIDISSNLVCAVCLSGITSELSFLPSVKGWQELSRGADADVLQAFGTAGRAAHTAVEYGTVGTPLVPQQGFT